MRLDKNGIPILDPPKEQNKLPKVCEHFWVEVSRNYTGHDYMEDRDKYTVWYRCRNCGKKYFDTEWEDDRPHYK